MKFSDNSMSAVLLCSYIGINNDDAYKPLTLKEWNELLDSVIEHGQQPSVVMDPSQSFLRETRLQSGLYRADKTSDVPGRNGGLSIGRAGGKRD